MPRIQEQDLVQGRLVDCADNGTNEFVPPRIIHCNVSNTYRFFDTRADYADMYLYKGLEYCGINVKKITTASNTSLTAGDITLKY